MKFIRSTLLLGLVLVAPAGLTFWVLVSVIRFFDETVKHVGLDLPPGFGLLVAIFFLFLVGLLGKTFAGRVLKNFFDWSLEQLPFIRGLYKLFNQMSEALFSGSSKSSFKKVVMVPFGSAQSFSIGFWVKELDHETAIVFVPTAPNPTSGFVLKVPVSALTEVKLSVEEAFKVIISCGALLPGQNSEVKRMANP